MQILVLGMHRSGTSAVARLLNLMGCYVGPEETLMRASEANPKGHWERLDVMQANERVLEALGGSWYEVADLKAPEDLSEEKLRELANELLFILLGLDAHRPWMVKDPRLCLTLPLWLPMLEAPRFVLVHRHPAQVARSLERRDGLPQAVGLALWEAYVLSSLRASAGFPRTLVRYEELVERPVETVGDLYGWLVEQGVGGLRQPLKEEITKFVDARLHRSKPPEGAESDVPVHLRGALRYVEEPQSWEDRPVPDLSEESARVLELFGPVRRELDRTRLDLEVCQAHRDDLAGFQERFQMAKGRLEVQSLLCERAERQCRELERRLRELEASLWEAERLSSETRTEHEKLVQQLDAALREAAAARQETERAQAEARREAERLTAMSRRRERLEEAVSELSQVIDGFLSSRTWRAGSWLSLPWRLATGRSPSGEERRDAVLDRLSENQDS